MRRLLLAALLLGPPPASAFAWGTFGHEVVAAVAERFLLPQARARVREILGGEGSLVEVANWADRAAKKRRGSARWHYVNIPKRAAVFDEKRDCPKGGCLVVALRYFREALGDPESSRDEKQEAVKFLVHLVGDLHQPLHCGYREDHGGNWVKLRFFRRRTNLHKVWDVDILSRNEAGFGVYVDHLSGRARPGDLEALMRGTVLDWVYESRGLLLDHVYNFDADRKLAQEYYNNSVVIVDNQLLKAGLRLAGILNESLGGE